MRHFTFVCFLATPSTGNRCLLPQFICSVSFILSVGIVCCYCNINCTRCDDNHKIFSSNAKQTNGNAALSAICPCVDRRSEMCLWQNEICNKFECYSHNHFQHIAHTIWDLYLANYVQSLAHINSKTSNCIRFEIGARHKHITIKKRITL